MTIDEYRRILECIGPELHPEVTNDGSRGRCVWGGGGVGRTRWGHRSMPHSACYPTFPAPPTVSVSPPPPAPPRAQLITVRHAPRHCSPARSRGDNRYQKSGRISALQTQSTSNLSDGDLVELEDAAGDVM